MISFVELAVDEVLRIKRDFALVSVVDSGISIAKNVAARAV